MIKPGTAENRGNDLSQAAKRIGIPLWGRLLIGGLLFVFTVGGGFLGRVLYKIDDHVSTIDGHVGKLQESVRILETQQPKAIQDIINSILQQIASAIKSGNLDRAEKAAIIAAALIDSEKAKNAEASPEFFKESFAHLQNVSASSPQLRRPLFDIKLSLAQYRSALETPPKLTDHPYLPERTLEMRANLIIQGNDSHPERVVTDGSRLPQNEEFYQPPSTKKLSDNIRVQGMTFVGASQILDGIHWENTMFINTRIKYLGGEVELNKVLFVNCIFEFQQGPRGERIANYVAEDFSTLFIGAGPT